MNLSVPRFAIVGAALTLASLAQAQQDRVEYRVLATTKTSTIQKELQEAGDEGFAIVGMTVWQTAMGGSELVSNTRRRAR